MGDILDLLDAFDKKEEPEPQAIKPRNEKPHIVTPPQKVSKRSKQAQDFEIGTACLFDWFEQNHKNFSNIGYVKTVIKNINPKRFLLYTYIDPEGEEGERALRLEKNAHIYQVLNIPAYAMEICTNGFTILYHHKDKILKGYSDRMGLDITFCTVIEDIPVPYARTKLRRGRSKGINVPEPNREEMIRRMPLKADMEAIYLTYPMFQKLAPKDILTNQQVLGWFLKRQSEMRDTIHLVLIDEILINIFSEWRMSS